MSFAIKHAALMLRFDAKLAQINSGIARTKVILAGKAQQ